MENCSQRFPYAAECEKKGVKQDTSCAEYQSRWSDDASGQKMWGGWLDAGRKRYRVHRRNIAVAKRSEENHKAEKAILRLLQERKKIEGPDQANILGDDGEITGVALINLASDDEEEGSDAEDLGDDFMAPPKKKPRKTKK